MNGKCVEEIQGIAVEIENKKIKHFHLSVYPPDARVHLSVPCETTREQARFYILQKWMWITEKRKDAMQVVYQPPREYVSGEEHFVRGQSYRLRVVVSKDSPQNVSFKDDYLVLTVHPNSSRIKRSKILYDWYREDLKIHLIKIIEKWEKILDVSVKDWNVKKMEMRWGSCNQSKATVIFNVELAKVPLHCLEYIVAHELAHIKEHRHNDKFQQLLFTYMPNWQKIRDDLNEFPLSGGVADE